MKTLLCASLVIFGIKAQADHVIAVGDSVTYQGIQNNSPFTLSSVITKDAGNQQWTVHSEQNYLGKISKFDETSQVITPETIQGVLDQCSDIGKLETIKVKAGTFLTCKISRPGSPTAWIGNVPFGLVKEENHAPGLSTTAELVSFHYGN